MSSKYERDLSIRQSYKRLFESEDGKRVLDDLKSRCGYDRTIFSNDPLVLACNEGGRSTLVYIMEQMKVDKLLKVVK